ALVRRGGFPRRRRLASAMPEGADRGVALVLMDLAAGAPRRGVAALSAAHARRPGAQGPLLALFLSEAPALVAGQDPDGLLPALESDAVASTVLEGGRLQPAGRGRESEALEASLP